MTTVTQDLQKKAVTWIASAANWTLTETSPHLVYVSVGSFHNIMAILIDLIQPGSGHILIISRMTCLIQRLSCLSICETRKSLTVWTSRTTGFKPQSADSRKSTFKPDTAYVVVGGNYATSTNRGPGDLKVSWKWDTSLRTSRKETDQDEYKPPSPIIFQQVSSQHLTAGYCWELAGRREHP